MVYTTGCLTMISNSNPEIIVKDSSRYKSKESDLKKRNPFLVFSKRDELLKYMKQSKQSLRYAQDLLHRNWKKQVWW
jgi:ABC-type Fe3+-citrate transport system substrate-binding protein